ncbi:MAG: rod shape-determining protein MreC [Bacteroidales bacterium]|nr:rod shape-determining protein MreC [Bacteroidales bacterium]
MPRGKSRYLNLLSAAIFIGLEFAALGLLSSSAPIQNIWLNRFSHRTMAFLWGGGEDLRGYIGLARRNEALERENEELSRMIREYSLRKFESEADSPEDLHGFRFTPATIVKMSRNNQHNYIILDKGSADGVKTECGIITANGVVGIIDAVDKHFSYGRAFTNANMKLSARIGRLGSVGPLTWDGISSGSAILKELPLQVTVHPGDTIFTSGFSSIFPPDIPLGIAGDTRVASGSTTEVHVSLFQDFSQLRFVTIVENLKLDAIKELENKVN